MNKEKFKQTVKKWENKQREYTARCTSCSKELMKKDADYSLLYFNGIYCSKHIPDLDKYGFKTNALKS